MKIRTHHPTSWSKICHPKVKVGNSSHLINVQKRTISRKVKLRENPRKQRLLGLELASNCEVASSRTRECVPSGSRQNSVTPEVVGTSMLPTVDSNAETMNNEIAADVLMQLQAGRGSNTANVPHQQHSNTGQHGNQFPQGVGAYVSTGQAQNTHLPSPQPACVGSNEMAQLIAAMTHLMQQNTALMATVTKSRDPGNQLFNVLPDLSHNIAEFDGLSGAANAKIWLQQLESTVTLHRWTEAVAFETARSHLTKAARNWYLGNIETIIDWQSFRKAFARTFLMEKSLTERWKEMQKRSQRPDDKTAKYFFDKVRLCKALKLPFDEIKKQVAVGLWSRSISAAIVNQSHFDLDDVLRTITEHETLETARKQIFGQKQNTPRLPADDRRSSTTEAKTEPQRAEHRGPQSGGERRSSSASTTSTTTDRECYRCHQKGHFVRNCTVQREVKCFNCRESGHIAKGCKKPRATSDSAVRYLDSDRANGGVKYYKRITIGRTGNIEAFIDPGSSDCLIKASLVLDNDYKYIRAPSTLIGFLGRVLPLTK